MSTVDHQHDNAGNHVFRIATKKPFQQFKEDSSRQLDSTWASFAVSYWWEGETCHYKGSFFGLGGWGKLVLKDEMIVVELHFQTWPPLPWPRRLWPASWIEQKIAEDIERAMEIVSKYSSLQEKEAKSRTELERAAFDSFYESYEHELVADALVDRWQVFDEVTKVVVALTTLTFTGSVITEWPPPNFFGAGLVIVGAVLASVNAALRIPERLKTWGEIKGHFGRLRVELDTFRDQMRVVSDFPIAEYNARFSDYRSRFADGLARRPNDLLLTEGLQRRARNRLPAEVRTERQALEGAHPPAAAAEARQPQAAL